MGSGRDGDAGDGESGEAGEDRPFAKQDKTLSVCLHAERAFGGRLGRALSTIHVA